MSRSAKNRKGPFKNLHRQLHLEMLEERAMPSCTAISGYVYYDANNNGLYDTATETPIANSSIALRDANNVVVGSTTTDANGFYKFDTDQAHPGTDKSLTKIVNLPTTATQTNYSLQGKVDKFDSSLGQLRRLPAQTLKIDESFISLIPDDANSCSITEAIIAMAKRLQLRTVAEGVETQAQLDFLRANGCDTYQGYLFAKPLTAIDVTAMFKSQRAAA